jgi:choline-sulfatase
MGLSRREFLASSAALAATVTNARALDPPRHNVVVLMSDEHNPFIASPWGHPFVHTPNMARLAQMGTVFENTYCPSPLCMPCRSALMSGQRVHTVQAYNNCNVFSSEFPSHGRVMRDQGVYTVFAGKTDVYRPGGELGFNEMLLPGDRGKPGDNNVSRDPLDVRQGAESRGGGYGAKDERDPFAKDNRIVDAAVEWITTKAKSVQQPWCLWVNTLKPHFPHNVTAELWEKYEDHEDLPAHGRDAASANHPYAADLRKHFQTDAFKEEQVRGLRRGYYGCVTFTDSLIGRLLDTLNAEGLTQNTVFAYSSDHGEMLGKFGMWWKSSLYEDSARVPLIVAGPGFKPGARVKTPVDLHDLRASAFQAIGAAQPRDWVGSPLQGIDQNDRDRAVFSEYHGHGTRGSGFVIRKGDWKLIHCTKAPHLLFNVAEDPNELSDLSEKNSEKLRELTADLQAICSPEKEQIRAEEYIGRQLLAMGRARKQAVTG